jgi:hypothetical protein
MSDAERPRPSRIPDATGDHATRHPLRGRLGYARGMWRLVIGVLVLAVAALFVVLVLVRQDVLSDGWTYVALPIAIAAAPLALVLTVFKAANETKQH